MNKSIIKNIILAGISTVFLSGIAMAETVSIVHVQDKCKYYVVKGTTGFHVVGAVNHPAATKGTKINGEFTGTGYKNMTIGADNSDVYMDVVSIKAVNMEDAKTELQYKCME